MFHVSLDTNFRKHAILIPDNQKLNKGWHSIITIAIFFQFNNQDM